MRKARLVAMLPAMKSIDIWNARPPWAPRRH
jgi:hypothetical protein